MFDFVMPFKVEEYYRNIFHMKMILWGKTDHFIFIKSPSNVIIYHVWLGVPPYTPPIIGFLIR